MDLHAEKRKGQVGHLKHRVTIQGKTGRVWIQKLSQKSKLHKLTYCFPFPAFYEENVLFWCS
jgi:hypothetical protein